MGRKKKGKKRAASTTTPSRAVKNPGKKVKIAEKACNSKQLPHTPIHDDDNMYTSLSSSSEDDESVVNTPHTRFAKKVVRDGAGRAVKINSKPGKKNQPIIALAKSEIVQPLLANINGCVFKYTERGLRIDIVDAKEHEEVQAILTSNQVPFYMYHVARTRPYKVVLFGLQEMEETALEVKLHAIDVKPEKLAKLTLKKPRYDRQAVYMLSFKTGATSMEYLRSIKTIDKISVRWDRYRAKNFNGLPQCRNCQRLGHSSENCRAPPRCLVCAEQHLTSNCTKKILRKDLKQKQLNGETIERSYIKCALCGEQHTANYLGCKERKQYINVQQKVIQDNPAKLRNRSRVNFNDKDAFPALTRNAMQQPQQQQQRPVTYAEVTSQKANETLLNQVQQILGSMQQMMKQMGEMMTVIVNAMQAIFPGTSMAR